MNARTQQDNDISLYSILELKAMQKRYNSNPSRWEPFTQQEIECEIVKREIPTELVDKAANLLKYNYSDTYIQSQMYASRNASTGILHIVEAINQAKKR